MVIGGDGFKVADAAGWKYRQRIDCRIMSGKASQGITDVFAKF